MSSAIKKRKFKSGIKFSKITPDRRKVLSDCFYHIFKSMQLCAWYVLYAPEYFDWGYEELKRFSDRMDHNNNAHGEDSFDYIEAERQLADEIDFDFVSESKKFPYRAKAKMYGKKIAPVDIPYMVEAMNRAVECSYFLAIYTLYNDFKLSIEDIKERFMPQFLQISYEYSAGLTDEIMLKYFRELSGWDIEEEEKEVQKIW